MQVAISKSRFLSLLHRTFDQSFRRLLLQAELAAGGVNKVWIQVEVFLQDNHHPVRPSEPMRSNS